MPTKIIAQSSDQVEAKFTVARYPSKCWCGCDQNYPAGTRIRTGLIDHEYKWMILAHAELRVRPELQATKPNVVRYAPCPQCHAQPGRPCVA